jgi:hypothetical protein
MADTTTEQLTRMVDEFRDVLGMAWADMLEPLGVIVDDLDDQDADASEYAQRGEEVFDGSVLDAYSVVHVYMNGVRSHRHVVIVWTVGGPHIEACVTPDGSVTVSGRWGSDIVSRFGVASADVLGWVESVAGDDA